MEKITNEVIIEKLQKIQQTISDISMDLEKDRNDIQNLNIRTQSMEASIEELRKSVNRTSEKTKDKVQDVLTPISEEVSRLSTSINKAKKVYVTNKISWWKRIIGGGGN